MRNPKTGTLVSYPCCMLECTNEATFEVAPDAGSPYADVYTHTCAQHLAAFCSELVPHIVTPIVHPIQAAD